MSIIDTLTIDGADLDETKFRLMRTYNAVVAAAVYYADASLGAAMVCYRAAENGESLAAIYTPYSESPRFAQKASEMVDVISDVASFLCAVYETADEDANEAYCQHLIEMSRIDKVSASLEAAHKRMQIVKACIPESTSPGARLKTAVFATKET
jgi:hypothetical protein